MLKILPGVYGIQSKTLSLTPLQPPLVVDDVADVGIGKGGGLVTEATRIYDALASAAAATALQRMSTEPLDPPHDDPVSRKRRAAVREGFEHAWEAYQLHAFGKDELKPLTSKGADVMGVGLTLVDAIDTMLIMGMHNSTAFTQARDWVRDSLPARPAADVSVFECSIRVLGGLLSAYALSGDSVFREKAHA
eukprot:CAMPEP_0173074330 /NCGR_PEP_ID=MMETSP1102-20130122/10943_1 /TAXON_ID=49646 /ORGANISM="Geminigera sp., Strain Caron Lab Isolate" /LENGTH=191 /DNA_ID=CAMNT_0013943359 /DNA_START=33 /DNA_END=604 /DNA_ORIENTATION=+